jgi:hypothetical protein
MNGFGVVIAGFEVGLDRGDELGTDLKTPRRMARRMAWSVMLRKPPLDQVEPGAGGRGEVQVEARVAVQPGDDVRVLVGGPGEIGDSNPGLFTLSGGPSSGLGGTALNGANRIAELR